MRKNIACSLAILVLRFMFVSAQTAAYPYTNARGEHEQFILDIEQSQQQETKAPVKMILLSTGIKMEYTEQGDKNGTPVILLHGFTDSYHSFDLALPHLPSSLHVFSLSQRGHGNSDRPDKGYHPKDFAADVAAFMDALQIKKAVIAGHSMGSIVTQQFVISYPQYVSGVVLIGAFARLHDKPELLEFGKVIAGLKDPIDYNFIKEFQQSTIIKPVPGHFFETVMQESVKVPAKVWRGVFEELLKVDNVQALTNVKTPAMIMWGNKDAFCPGKDQQTLLTAIDGSVLITYPDIGHAPHWEVPERFAADLVNFINTLK